MSVGQSVHSRNAIGYLHLSVDERTPEVRNALVKALENENERRKQFHLSEAPYLYEGDDTSALELARQVTDLRDPATIPVLLPWLCCGWADDLIDLGRASFEPVLRFVEAGEPGTENALWGGLGALRMMVDHWGLDSFSGSERARMSKLVSRYLANEGVTESGDGWSELQMAIRLAASLQESALLQEAQRIVYDESELGKRGIMEPDLRQILQKTVAQALAGTLELRQYVPYEQRRLH